MRFTESKFEDVHLNSLDKKLSSIFTKLSKDNFVTMTIDDVTDASANTSKIFKHGFGTIPAFLFILEGNAYVQYGSVTENQLDIRSTGTSQKFKLLIIK